jgi:hypothetical protein
VSFIEKKKKKKKKKREDCRKLSGMQEKKKKESGMGMRFCTWAVCCPFYPKVEKKKKKVGAIYLAIFGSLR